MTYPHPLPKGKGDNPYPDPLPKGKAAVLAVSLSPGYTFSKPNAESITLIVGHGVEGDAHAGATVKHRYLAERNPTVPNLRQVHLIQSELHEELRKDGFEIAPGEMGENITTRGIDLLELPTGTLLRLGNEAVVEVTGLRSPCGQLDNFQHGLKAAVIEKNTSGSVTLKSGIMGIVVNGGEVQPGDPIVVELPEGPHQPLVCV